MNQRLISIAGVLLLLWSVHFGTHANAKDDLWSLISKIQTQEEHYEHIDVSYSRYYEHVEYKKLLDEAALEPGSQRKQDLFNSDRRVIVQRAEQIRFVRQDDMVHVDWKNNSIGRDGSKKSLLRELYCDGKECRLSTNSTRKESKSWGGIVDRTVLLPHTIVFRQGFPTETSEGLSKYIKEKYLKDNAATKELTYMGRESLQGLDCHKLMIMGDDNLGRTMLRQELWLAVSRNLIPLKRLVYQPRLSENFPLTIALVEEWRELQPGVWFPFSTKVTHFDGQAIQDHGEQRMNWEKLLSVEKAVLNPQHSQSFFAPSHDAD